MKFDTGLETEFGIDEERGYERLFTTRDKGLPCGNCSELTSWHNIAFSAPACSHECVDRIWAGYFKNLEKSLVRIRELLKTQDLEEIIQNQVEGLDRELELVEEFQWNGSGGVLN